MPMQEKNVDHSAKKEVGSFFGPKQRIRLMIYVVVTAASVSFVSLSVYGFISLNNRANKQTEEIDRLKESCPTIQEEATGERTKRSAKRPNTQEILKRLRKMEERWNQSYRSVGRQPAFVLRGPPGKPGRDGIPGLSGSPGQNGMPGKGTNGRDGRDGAQGPKGVRGNRGQPGLQGISGAKGDQGNRGNPGVSGVSYIRWGKKKCPSNGAKLVYEGYAGGSYYSHRGGGANYVCLTRNPVYGKYQSGFQYAARIYGAEYQIHTTGIFPSSLNDHDVPCALCHVNTRATQMMIPGTNVCPAGWTREYKGYLMTEHHSHHRTMYTCVDENPDYVPGTHANRDGALFYFVEGACGSLPCKPYVNGRELTCAVCTR